ncbi:hypothetical protein SESBI_43194 [Sesbania bispinosa]|nr:hypothetical protein SESBI_43194 [Sesbania bispinosa]
MQENIHIHTHYISFLGTSGYTKKHKDCKDVVRIKLRFMCCGQKETMRQAEKKAQQNIYYIQYEEMRRLDVDKCLKNH